MADENVRSHEYELGHSDWELKRLETQAALVNPFTLDYFRRAGIKSGMRVLDVGSGGGDVALLVASVVGSDGEVIGSDRSPAAVAAARARTLREGAHNVSFVEGDPSSLAFEQPFDAVVGRYVLMFSPNPTALLKGVARHLKRGGLIVFHESDFSGARSVPPAKLYDQCFAWIIATFKHVGTHTTMGLSLYRTFLDAGLPPPMIGIQALGGGADSLGNGIDLLADLAITMAAVMEEHGVVRGSELDPGSLYDRMLREVAANGSVVTSRFEVGAWARVE